MKRGSRRVHPRRAGPIHAGAQLLPARQDGGGRPAFDARKAQKKLRRFVEGSDHAIRLNYVDKTLAGVRADEQTVADVVTGKLNVRGAAAELPEDDVPGDAEEPAGRVHDRTGGDGMTDWSTCPAVERNPTKISGAWAFTGTRVPVYALFENLESGATVNQFLEWFPEVKKRQVAAVLKHEAEHLKAPNSHMKVLFDHGRSTARRTLGSPDLNAGEG